MKKFAPGYYLQENTPNNDSRLFIVYPSGRLEFWKAYFEVWSTNTFWTAEDWRDSLEESIYLGPL